MRFLLNWGGHYHPHLSNIFLIFWLQRNLRDFEGDFVFIQKSILFKNSCAHTYCTLTPLNVLEINYTRKQFFENYVDILLVYIVFL
jgi:hypothetical protein